MLTADLMIGRQAAMSKLMANLQPCNPLSVCKKRMYLCVINV